MPKFPSVLFRAIYQMYTQCPFWMTQNTLAPALSFRTPVYEAVTWERSTPCASSAPREGACDSGDGLFVICKSVGHYLVLARELAKPRWNSLSQVSFLLLLFMPGVHRENLYLH